MGTLQQLKAIKLAPVQTLIVVRRPPACTCPRKISGVYFCVAASSMHAPGIFCVFARMVNQCFCAVSRLAETEGGVYQPTNFPAESVIWNQPTNFWAGLDDNLIRNGFGTA